MFFCQLIHSLFIQNQELLLHTQLLKDCYNSQFPGTFNENLPYYSSIKGYILWGSQNNRKICHEIANKDFIYLVDLNLLLQCAWLPMTFPVVTKVLYGKQKTGEIASSSKFLLIQLLNWLKDIFTVYLASLPSVVPKYFKLFYKVQI